MILNRVATSATKSFDTTVAYSSERIKHLYSYSTCSVFRSARHGCMGDELVGSSMHSIHFRRRRPM